MTEDDLEAHQPIFRGNQNGGVQHREIGLRAVAAAVLYQGGHAERTIWRELPVSAGSLTPSNDGEA